MRRRVPAVAVTAPPAELVRFDPDDWPVLDPEPQSWRDGVDEPYPWRLFCRRLAWQRARRAWAAEQGDPREARAVLAATRAH